MKSTCNPLLCSNNWNRVAIFTIVILVLFTITGCVEQVVKVIVIPVRTGGGGVAVFIFCILSVMAIFDKRESISPEQSQIRQNNIKKQEIEQNNAFLVDLPNNLSPSSNNYIRTNVKTTLSIIVVKSKTLSADHNFQVYSKYNSRDSIWKKEELLNVRVENNDNQVDRRLLFSVKDSVWTDNVVVTWDDANIEHDNHENQMPAANNTSQPIDDNKTTNVNTQQQQNNYAKDGDPSGL